jgi:signal transduction histidine kinase
MQMQMSNSCGSSSGSNDVGGDYDDHDHDDGSCSSTSSIERRGLEVARQALAKGSRLRILIPSNNESMEQETILNKAKILLPKASFRSIDKSLETRLTILIVDGQESLVFELKDDTATNSYDAVGIATYSDSKPIASSYSTIFESLWKQSELYEQLKVNDKLQKEFINIAAHELRSPVQPILGLAELLVNYGKNNSSSNNPDRMTIENQWQYHEIILRNAKRLERLTHDILQVARIESNSLVLKKERIDIRELVNSVIDDFKGIAEQKGIKIIKKIYREQQLLLSLNEPVYVDCDAEKISEVLNNILSNALKFAKEQGTIKIEITISKRDENMVLAIHDTGYGIDAEIMPRLFTKFATKSFQGTGLGLYISKKIVEAHGGRIWAENNYSNNNNNINSEVTGATFYFTLPLSNSTVDAKVQQQQERIE